MLILQIRICKDCSEYIPCDSSSRLLISVLSASASSILCCKFAISTVWTVSEEVTACVPINHITCWHIFGSSDRLPREANQSLRGYYLYIGVFLNKTQSNILRYKPRSLLAGPRRPHSICISRPGPFRPPCPSRYDVPPRRMPVVACSSIYPAPLGLQRLP